MPAFTGTGSRRDDGVRLARAGPLAPGSAQAALFADRLPVIGHGSNRSPEQLRRKFGARAEIPVSRAWLSDYDVVYSAHVTQYGSIAANLQHTPGARAEVYADIPQMTSKTMEIVPPSHRQGNGIPSAAIR